MTQCLLKHRLPLKCIARCGSFSSRLGVQFFKHCCGTVGTGDQRKSSWETGREFPELPGEGWRGQRWESCSREFLYLLVAEHAERKFSVCEKCLFILVVQNQNSVPLRRESVSTNGTGQERLRKICSSVATAQPVRALSWDQPALNQVPVPLGAWEELQAAHQLWLTFTYMD